MARVKADAIARSVARDGGADGGTMGDIGVIARIFDDGCHGAIAG